MKKSRTREKLSKKAEYEPSFASKILLNLIFLILVGILLGSLYFLYTNIPGEPQVLDVDVGRISESKPRLSEVRQFYTNMKFNHNDISYAFLPNCGSAEKARMKEAFQEVSLRITKISFREVSSQGDITISCTEKSENIQEDFFVAGEGGAKEIIPTGRYNIINQGIIYLYDNPKKRTVKCDYPNIEVHELMHVFGFDHSENKDSLMYPVLDTCDQTLDESIAKDLNELYSHKNAADLYFENVYVVKKGRYLDFNVTIKNSGAVNSDYTELHVLDNGEIIESYDIEPIKYGGGLFLQINNLRLERRNPSSIQFVIDMETVVDEIDEDNNVAIVKIAI